MTERASETTRIAVVGMAGRFPGADDVRALWDLLVTGEVAVRPLADEVLRAAGVPAVRLADPAYVRACAQAAGLDRFDPDEYGMTPREAVMCDPQTRLLLQLTTGCFLDAGIAPSATPDTAVYVSTGHSRYVELFGRVDWRSTHGASLMTGTNLDYASSLIAYKFALRGAAVTVQTACSSSLVAVHQACRALADGQCDQAVAGGATVLLPLDQGYRWEGGGPASRSGRCRPFDATADGTVFGSGGAVVLLKRLEDARADGDLVHAVIEGTAVNNDGADKTGFTAPSVRGQAGAIAEAMLVAGVAPEDVGMVESHGTGTILGDPIEWQGIRRAFDLLGGRGTADPCAVTAVKGNVGHLGHAAGVASLVKGVLAVEHGIVPPTGGLERPSLALAGLDDELHLPLGPVPLGARHVGVSSFGVGGTNAHAVLGPGAPVAAAEPADEPRRAVLLWSAASGSSRDAYRAALARADAPAGALAATLSGVAAGAAGFRAAAVAEPGDALAPLLADGSGAVLVGEPRGPRGRSLWVVPGEDALPDDGLDGLARHPDTREHLEPWRTAFAAAGVDLDRCGARHAAGERSPSVREPLAVAASGCLAQAWSDLAGPPDVVAGTGVGELVAAVVAGLLDPAAVARVVAARVGVLDGLAPVDRMVVAEPDDIVTRIVVDDDPRVTVTRTDHDEQTVLVAPPEVVTELESTCRMMRLRTRRTAAASPAGTPAADAAAAAVRGLGLVVAEPPADGPRFVGALVATAEPSTADYWAALVASPADESRMVAEVDAAAVVLEVGAGHDLTTMLSRHHPGRVVPSLPRGAATADAVTDGILDAAVRLWVAGADVDVPALAGVDRSRRARLPQRPVHGERYWPGPDDVRAAEAPSVASAAGGSPAADAEPGEAPGRLDAIVWEPDLGLRAATDAPPGSTLVLLPTGADARTREVAAQVAGAVDGSATVVEVGGEDPADGVRRALAEHLADPDGTVHVVHALALGPAPAGETVADQWALAFASLAAVAGAAHRAGAAVRLTVLTTHGADVTGDEPVRPGLAAAWPLVQTLVSEGAVASATVVDVSPSTPVHRVAAGSADAGARATAVRPSGAWRPARRPVAAGDPVPDGRASTWRPGGTYLVTGGGGGLGGVLCERLATLDPQAEIVLLGRTERPPTPAHDSARRLGAVLRPVVCDIADAGAVARVVDETVAASGPVRGVFHLAGSLGAGVTALADRSASDAVRAKVDGTIALLAALAPHPAPALVMAFSSRAALDGQPGGGDYAAANAVMTALLARADAGRVLSVAWPAWRETGMATGYLAAAGLDHGLTTAEGAEALADLLGGDPPPHVAVRDARPDGGSLSAPAPAPAPTPAAEVPADTRRALLEIWEAVLGIADLDDDADFFQVGGNSLTAVELVSRTQQRFGLDLDLGTVFDAPTVRALTAAIDERLGR